MAKRCPVDGEMKIYLQCMECDEKECMHPKSVSGNESNTKDALYQCEKINGHYGDS